MSAIILKILRDLVMSHNPYQMGLGATKSLFEVSDDVIQKTVCSATETSYNGGISLLAIFDILSNKRIT